MRLGLCCIFHSEPIKFRTTTAAHITRLPSKKRAQKLAELCMHNALTLKQALEYCIRHNIKAFRVNSQILPLKTHPKRGYELTDLPNGNTIIEAFCAVGAYAKKHDIRLSFHPDQFILLSSPKKEVTRQAIAELDYHAMVSEWIGADVITIHGGGAYGEKQTALKRVGRTITKLKKRITDRLVLENDDRIYTPEDILPLCEKYGIPFCYDVHHHRCLSDSLTIDKATERAVQTWNREPLFHISSPREGWQSKRPQYHHDYIQIKDFPACWANLDITVEVEAKAKELAVIKLRKDLARKKYL